MSQIPSAPHPPASQEPTRRSCPPCPPCPPCPVDELRPELLRLLENGGNMVLSAPPPETADRVPLWLLDAPWLAGRKILLLEPRRVAARALGRYMARLLGEEPGQTVGWHACARKASSARTPALKSLPGRADPPVAGRPGTARGSLRDFRRISRALAPGRSGPGALPGKRAALRPDLRRWSCPPRWTLRAVARLLKLPSPQAVGAFPVETRRLPLRGMERPLAPNSGGIQRR